MTTMASLLPLTFQTRAASTDLKETRERRADQNQTGQGAALKRFSSESELGQVESTT